MSAYPDYVARFYDVVYAQVRDAADKDYYVRKLASCRGRSLEVGVGTGRIFLEALKRGADVYGLDSSAEMIAVLRGKLDAEDHHRVMQSDLAQMSFGKRFDLVVAPFRVFSHIIDADDQIRALNVVHDHLNPGGVFLFDLFVPNLKLLLEGQAPVTDFDGEYAPGLRLKRTVSASSDLISQVTSVTMAFDWDEGGRRLNAEWSFPFRFYFRYEIEHLVARSKLKLEAIYGDYAESPLNSTSKEFLVHCIR
ncbi:MAG: class I SAM-dependent methyltransferase [Candidatus Aminicenantes bacterium]|nr:class I SAM-dependent methyltransferase [Candidatus Aminicenantes bacterium]